ncbi:hypothetical protein A1O3_07825 [Capronia epimyces CBS 606.96]|uniref:L-ornithine N(5)-oxygenase n=1 Tax=Capronia epimyces CBS 606.96 TaxID=1182542 RepID=W9XRD0_9EURO|nr:uncharacterized protein A1O3_07825 [Capronia epimyces CBS 606.96]EXJ79546.1 hypothetical protein A1O3_07825 [Capronia epimyces CBS 606.96]
MGSLFEEVPLPSHPAVAVPATATATAKTTASSSRYDAKYFPKQEPWNPHRPVKIVIVGGGIAGVTAAVLLSHKVPNAIIALYERQDKVGGTWALNVYPGVRCDVPSHAYQLNVDPSPDWSEYYPKGAEIQQYWERVVERHGLTGSVHVKREVLAATWLKGANQWAVEVKNLEDGTVAVDTADFFVSAQGRINVPKYPQVEGLHDVFGGDVIHTSSWPSGYDLKGKRVAVIGNGASGQQLVPNILPQVSQLDHYVRTKTWVTATFSRGLHEATADAPGGPLYTDEEKRAFREDPALYLEHRRFFALKFQRPPGSEILGSDANNQLREQIIETMRHRLGGDEEWLARVLPDYAPGCKRLTPAPGYLEALQQDKVDYVVDPIVRVDETGIITADGKHRPVDVIVAATGFQLGYTSLFPVIGPDGVDIRDKWQPGGEIGYPESYLGIMAPGYPNYFTVLQAQGNARGGSVPLQCENAATYIAKAIRKVQAQSYISLEPRKDAAEEFNDISNGYFDGKVIRDKCNSWAKLGGGDARVVLAWPGTYHHRAAALRDPRWEDFVFQRRPGASRNRFEYFGDGSTIREVTVRDDKDLTRYLREADKYDIATVHELWNE